MEIIKFNNSILKFNGQPLSWGGIAPAAAYPTTGLISRWQFEDNLDDSFGGKTLTPDGGPSFINGKVGKAYAYGTSAYSNDSVFTDLFNGNNSFGLSFWIKRTGTDGDFVPFCACNESGDNNSSLNQFYFQNTGVASFNRAGQNRDYTFTVNFDTYQHFVFSRNATTLETKMYFNSNEVSGTVRTQDTVISGVTRIHIMSRVYSFGIRNWSLDQLYLYNRPLTPTEVSQLYNSGNGI
jgi:hypothetical protein